LKIAWIADDGALVKKNDVVVRFDPTDFQKDLLAGGDDRHTVGNKITKTTTLASTTRTNLKRDARQAQDELLAAKQFKFDDAEVFSRYQRIESEIDQTLAGNKKEHAENVLGVRDTLSKADRDLLTIEEKKAGLKIRNAQQGLHSLELSLRTTASSCCSATGAATFRASATTSGPGKRSARFLTCTR